MPQSPSWKTLLALAVGVGIAGPSQSSVVRVPQDFSGIQPAIDAARNGDVIKIAPGTYVGGLTLTGKTITLASTYVDSHDPAVIAQTVIDGGAPILTIDASVGANTTIQGLTFRNGNYQIENYARRVNFLNDRFIDGSGDQLSFEGAGGTVRDCLFSNSGDDGIDSDNDSDPTVENCTFQNSGDDGIEIRLQGYTGSTLEISITGCTFTGCSEDGLQLIDYSGASSRAFTVEHNVFSANAKAGLGSMANGNTNEDFAGAPMVEPVRVIGNTFSGNPYGLTGGDNMLVMNNIFTGSSQIGVKRVAGSSLATYNDFWSNGTDASGSNLNAATTYHQNPLLTSSFDLMPGSPCIDAGAASVVWNGTTVTAPPYSGAAPDLGAHESGGAVSVPEPVRSGDLAIEGVRPNPSRDGFSVLFTLPDSSPARLELMDLEGRRILTQEVTGGSGQSQLVTLPETRGLRAGVYLVRLIQGVRSRTTRCVVMR